MASKGKRPSAGRPKNIEQEQTTISIGGQLALSPWGLNRKSKGAMWELQPQDDLGNRRGFRIYREMMTDDTVKALVNFKKVLITGRAWQIVPAGGKDASDQNKSISDFITWNLVQARWNKIQRNMYSSLVFGFSTGEIIWKVDTYPEDGSLKVMLDDVHDRDPESMRIEVDEHGNIMAFRQTIGWPPAFSLIEPEKILHLAHQAEFSNWYGISDLRAAYKQWWSKKFVIQFWNVFMERFGSPLMAVKYPQGAPQELKEKLQQIIASLSSKTDILIPDGVIIQLIEATRGGQGNYQQALEYFDVGMSRALLLPALLGMGVDVKRGSDSQSRLQLRVLMKVTNDVAQDGVDEINEKIIKPLVDYNYPDVKEYPTYQYQDYGEYEATSLVETISGLFTAGILDMDQDDVNYCRSVLGLPIRTEDDADEVLRSMPPPIGTSPNDPNASTPNNPQGAGGKKGNQRAAKRAGQKTTDPRTKA